MKNSSGIKSRIRIALLALMAVAVLVFWAAGIVMLSRTFVVWWIPVAISLAVSVMLLPLLLRFLRAVIPVGNDIVNVMIHLAAVGGLLFFLFLGLNTWIPRTDIPDVIRVTAVWVVTGIWLTVIVGAMALNCGAVVATARKQSVNR